MKNLELHERLLEHKDWAILVFIFVLILIAIVKTNFENRFFDFMRLFSTSKYVKIYKDGSLIMSWFTVILFIVQLLSLTFFIQLILHYFTIVSKNDYVVFIQIFTILFVFVLAKFLFEKIIATVFDIEEQVDMYNMTKVSYRSYIMTLLLPVNIFLFYSNNVSIMLIYCIIFIIIGFNVITYVKVIKTYQNLIFGNLIYYILYLCTLEIAPYYFLYYWFARK